MKIEVILLRLFLAFIFSAVIGYEREVNQSNAGLKTHILVAIGSALIAIIQIEVVEYVRDIAALNVLGVVNVTADASRLISQVISGIGFLGAGTIIVTKRNVSGLTTAASIWATASIALALGMGFYKAALIGFSFVLLTLFLFNKLFNIQHSYRVIIKYIGGDESLEQIKTTLTDLSLTYQLASYRSEITDSYIIRENVFIIKDPSNIEFQKIVSKLSTKNNIVSVERTNLY